MPEIEPERAVPAALERVVDAVVLHRAYSSVPGGASGSLYDTATEAYRSFFRELGVTIGGSLNKFAADRDDITVSELMDLFVADMSTAVVVELTSAMALVQLLTETLSDHTGLSPEVVLSEVLEKAKGN